MPYLVVVHKKITLKTSTRFSWDINISNANGRVFLDHGWPAFAIAHDLKIGFHLTFKKFSPRVYKVMSFDYSGAEVVKRCPERTRCRLEGG
jgi:hypothetical protein